MYTLYKRGVLLITHKMYSLILLHLKITFFYNIYPLTDISLATKHILFGNIGCRLLFAIFVIIVINMLFLTYPQLYRENLFFHHYVVL